MDSTSFDASAYFSPTDQTLFRGSSVVHRQAALRSISPDDCLLPQIGANDWAFPQASTTGERSVSSEAPFAFVASISWVARVDEVIAEKGKFTAVLTSEGNPDEIAELDMSDVSLDDQNLVVPGAVFYWSIGQTLDRSGRKMNASVIRFQRIRHWRRGEIERAKHNAAKFDHWLTPVS